MVVGSDCRLHGTYDLTYSGTGPTSSQSVRTVGTAKGSNSSARAGSIGTHTRPVLGWMQNGLLSKWFWDLETFASRRG
jgi:hypothetical protein